MAESLELLGPKHCAGPIVFTASFMNQGMAVPWDR